jgi:hypothetical protein
VAAQSSRVRSPRPGQPFSRDSRSRTSRCRTGSPSGAPAAPRRQQEVAGAGFAEVRVLGIEGPAWTIVDAPGDDADARLDSALRCAQLTENFAEIVDASAHLMALATAPWPQGPRRGG